MQQAQLALDPDGLFDIDFSGVTRLIGDAANGCASDPVVYTGQSELVMRKFIAHFGFNRLPLTWAELNGMLDYCQDMHRFSGVGIPEKMLVYWKESVREVEEKYHPWRIPAFDAYAAGAQAELIKIHIEAKTLEKIASEFLEFDHGPLGHLD